MKTTIAAQAPFDILVNNAGTNQPALFVDVKVEDFDFVFELNVRAAYFVAQAVARELIEAKKPGSIINMSSQMGHVGGPHAHGLLRHQARDGRLHQGDGDRAGAAQDPRQHAGADLHRDADDAAVLPERGVPRRHAQRIKLGRLGQLEDLTGAIVFLASDASALMTGTSLVIDGGWTAE